jgi:two-component system nitrogen regulation sensor histidine kinase GlnL
MINLIANALDALAGEGELRVSLKSVTFKTRKKRGGSRRGLIKLAVVDNGPGMTEEELARVFTPYFTTKSKGTGLGLVIVQKIIEQHNGRLNFRSAPGQGTSVEISLPFKIHI